MARATNWSLMAHNRYWSASTPYAQQNGGAWPFEVDRASGFAVPASRAFWDHLFARAARRGWRLRTYEQDWMNFQHERRRTLRNWAAASPTTATCERPWRRSPGLRRPTRRFGSSEAVGAPAEE